jgi:hypothetical protein
MDASHRPRLRGMPRIITRTQGQPRFLRAFSVFVFLVPVNTPSHPKALGWGVSRGFEIFLWRGWGHTNTHRRRRACGNPPGSNVVVRRLFFRLVARPLRHARRPGPLRIGRAPPPPRFAPRPAPMPAVGVALCGRPAPSPWACGGSEVHGSPSLPSPSSPWSSSPWGRCCRRCSRCLRGLRGRQGPWRRRRRRRGCHRRRRRLCLPAPSALVPWPVRHPRARAYI